MHDHNDWVVSCEGFMEALPLLRMATGSSLNSQVDTVWERVNLASLGPDGLTYEVLNGTPSSRLNAWSFHKVWMADGSIKGIEDPSLTLAATPSKCGRILGTMTVYYLHDQNPVWTRTIHFFWGMVCVQMNLAEEAYQALKKVVSLSPDNAYYNYAIGAVALEREEPSEAILYFQKYCQLKPHDAQGRLALGSAYFASRDDVNAEKIILTVADNSETAAGAHYYLGRIAIQKGNYPEAVARLEMALKTNPNYTDAYAERGLVHLKQKDYPGAKIDLQKPWRSTPITTQQI
jgi:Tfp pilus assembly protein PilF